MAPDRERHTRRQIKEGRAAQQAADRLEREADRMEQRSAELGSEIDQTRSDWQRKRADEGVPGAVPPENQEGPHEESSHPANDEDGNASRDSADRDENDSSGAEEDANRSA